MQRLDYQQGRLSGFDFARIEAELKKSLLGSAGPIAVHTRQFQYAGELKRTGGLRFLGSRLRQAALSSSMLDQVWAEIDTKNRLVRLMTQLEECISFLLSTGSSQRSAAAHQQLQSPAAVESAGAVGGEQEHTEEEDEGEVLVEHYVLQTLLVDPQRWAEVACASVSQHVRLKHLQSLYLGLEERSRGDPLEDVALKYRGATTHLTYICC